MRLRLLVPVIAFALVPAAAFGLCRCRHTRTPRCTDPAALHRLTVQIDLAVVNDAVEVITQSGPYQMPVSELDGKTALFVVMPKGEVFQGFVQDTVPNSVTVGTMQGARATLTTAAAFAPGEYELQIFVDSAPGGALAPQRGDLAAFDNGDCEPTGVSVRFAVGCEDTTVTLTNRHFILF